LLAILSASQALSAQTSIERLHARVVEILGAMTGATGVQLLLCSDDLHDWLLPSPAGGTTPISGTGHEPSLVTPEIGKVRNPLSFKACSSRNRHGWRLRVGSLRRTANPLVPH
jgi:hypothetical protein